MKLSEFISKHSGKLNYLQLLFIENIFFKDYGEKGLDLIYPEYEIKREDGTDQSFFIDFVIITSRKKYAVETHGFHAHDESGRFVTNERFNILQIKNNLIRDKFDEYIEITKDQIESINDARFELRKYFKSEKELFDLYLNRSSLKISPNEVQTNALKNLDEGRNEGKKAGLAILATGLGKTFLSGFDIQNSNSRSVLFIAHVSEILRKTKNDFEDLMKDRFHDMEIFSSNTVITKNKIYFATIQSIHKSNNLNKFTRDFFDYIVIDEAHHAAASTYQKVTSYFKPKFLLGLTATPFRSDEKEILPSFDNNIFYQMDQEQAIKEGYLADIKYIGFYDDIDYSDIRWNGTKYDLDDLNKKLMIEKRDVSIINSYKKECKLGEKTIGFCTSIEHADYMADIFNKSGIKSISIHSRSENTRSKFSVKERESLIQSFRDNKFKVAFTVNMFNEGVDIPDVSSILMLRPTDSLTIFIQQIGRGLRLSDGKEYLKVLDFIGNYRTADIIVKGLGINVSDLTFDKEKNIYYYNNKGLEVCFDSETVEIFKAIISKKSNTVNIDEIDEKWVDYANFLDKSTTTDSANQNSFTQYWQVDKKKKDLKAHLWAIEFYLNNLDKYKTLSALDIELRNEAKKSGFIIEGTRALFFSKLLGIITNTSPFEPTDVYLNIKNRPSDTESIISSQMEKLYFWNDIYSTTNRHSSGQLTAKEEIFSIYPILYIYQLLFKLHSLGERVELTKFELDYFVFFSRNHDQVQDTLENIISYRNSKNIYELEKYLKLSVKTDKKSEKFNIFDTRYFSVLKLVKYFIWTPKKGIKLKENYQEELSFKVKNFEQIIEERSIFYDTEYSEYRKLLYSDNDFFKFFNKPL